MHFCRSAKFSLESYTIPTDFNASQRHISLKRPLHHVSLIYLALYGTVSTNYYLVNLFLKAHKNSYKPLFSV